MSKLLKNVYTKTYLTRVAQAFKKYYSPLKVDDFIQRVTDGNWPKLEFKNRVRKISLTLGEQLPSDYREALPIVVQTSREGFSSYPAIFFPDFVEAYGQSPRYRQEGLEALKVMTSYSTSELAIRPFLQNHLQETMECLLEWSGDTNFHVRRWCSEACRPRLPWAPQIQALRKDPSLIWPILENLKRDSSPYVRKSVANNLNDISKDHPQLALQVSGRWFHKKAHQHTRWIVKHGLRTLLKGGNREALKLFHYGNPQNITREKIILEKNNVVIGEDLNFQVQIKIEKPLKLRLEYALYFLRKRGEYTRKIFKIREREVSSGKLSLKQKHSFKLLSSRNYYPGSHKISLVVNGREGKSVEFQLLPPYWVYIIETKSQKFYTGMALNPDQRFREHLTHNKKGPGAKYFRSDPPLAIVYRELVGSRSQALRREAYIKGLRHSQKKEMILSVE